MQCGLPANPQLGLIFVGYPQTCKNWAYLRICGQPTLHPFTFIHHHSVYFHCKSFFFEQSGVFGKISKDVMFPEHLNLSQYMCGTDDSSPVYSLYAVVVHHDVMNATMCGHYVCYVKDSQGKWHEVDDSKVNNIFSKPA